MRRDDFINPSHFGRYDYKYLGELKQANRILDVIAFAPKKGSIIGGEYQGKIYLDLKEKVFVKAEYQFTTAGFLINPHNRWADQRLFITEYTADANGKWYLQYVWDEAVAYKSNFLLRQHFTTHEITPDTTVNWAYTEKLHFMETLVDKEADTLSGSSINQLSDKNQLFKTGKLLFFLRNFEIGYGLLTCLPQQTPIQLMGNVNNQNQVVSFNKKFDPVSPQFGFSSSIAYKMSPKSRFFLQQENTFSKHTAINLYKMGYSYRIYFKTNRPTNLNLNIAYTYALNEFVFDKTNEVTPTYRLTRHGISPSLMYEVNLSPMFKIGLGYAYLIPIADKSSFYLREKYGLFDLFSKKIKYDMEETNLTIDGASARELPWVFSSHSLELRITMMFQ